MTLPHTISAHEPPGGDALATAPINRHPVISEPFSIFLDHIRWISALLVVIGHVRQLFFVDYADVTHKSPFWGVFYAISRVQHQAVLIFFLLSGAVIAGRFTQWRNWQRFSLLDYTLARLTRLWLVLVPVLALCVMQLWMTPAILLPPVCGTGPLRVLGNLFFAQEILVDPLCNNVPLWSLANEFWYYFLAGGTVFAVTTRDARARVIAIGALALCVTVIAVFDRWTEKAVLPYFPIWLMGALALHPRLRSLPIPLAGALFIVMVGLVRTLPLAFYLRDWLFAFAGLQLLLSARDVPIGSRFAAAMRGTAWLARPLSGQSYSLYLVHFPICIAALGIILAQGSAPRAQPGGWGLLVLAGVLVFSYGLAQLMYVLFESRTAAVRAAIAERLRGSIA